MGLNWGYCGRGIGLLVFLAFVEGLEGCAFVLQESGDVLVVPIPRDEAVEEEGLPERLGFRPS